MARKFVDSQTFQGGLVTVLPPHLLADGATPSCKNVDFSTSLGRLSKRQGHTVSTYAPNLGAWSGLVETYISGTLDGYFGAIDKMLYKVYPNSLIIPVGASTPAGKVVNTITEVAGVSATVDSTAHGYSNGDTVFLTYISTSGMAAYGNRIYTISGVTANTFVLNGILPAGSGVLGGTTILAFKLTLAASNYGETNFVVFNNLAILVSPTSSTLKNAGSAANFSVLLGTPPANGHFIESHKQKVFIANTSAGTSRLHWCVTDDAEDWTTITGDSTDAGFIDVGKDDGDEITGIKSIGSVLLIFKHNSTWILSGNNATDFKVRKISPNVGCMANRTIVACDAFAIFLSNLGVYSANSDNVTMLSYNIKPTLDALTAAQRATATAGRYQTQYWLGIDTDNDTKADAVYTLDYVYGIWGYYTNKKTGVYITLRDGTLVGGSSENGNIFTHNSTNNDDGAAISMEWYTPEYDFGAWVSVKHPLDIIMAAKPISGKTITVQHLVDGVIQSQSLSYPLTASGSQTKIYLKKRHVAGTSYGGYLQFLFTNAQTDAPINIYAFNIAANVDERQNG